MKKEKWGEENSDKWHGEDVFIGFFASVFTGNIPAFRNHRSLRLAGKPGARKMEDNQIRKHLNKLHRSPWGLISFTHKF